MAKRVTRVHPEANKMIEDIPAMLIKASENVHISITIISDVWASVSMNGKTPYCIKGGWLHEHQAMYLFKKTASAKLVKALAGLTGHDNIFVDDRRN